VQTAAFMPGQRRADDQVGNLNQIAQLDQVGRHAEMAVIILDFLAQQVDTVLGALQPFCRADDAYKIPHELADFTPALLDHNLFITVCDPAFVPWRIAGGGGRLSQFASICRAQASPNTKHSSSELEARRFAPCNPD
jgi:hypothetical protein